MTPHFFAREIVDDCLQVRISKNLMFHAYYCIRDSMLSFSFFGFYKCAHQVRKNAYRMKQNMINRSRIVI